LTQEVHLIHRFDEDFYNEMLKVVVLGYIRPELNYTTLGICMLMTEALVNDIQTDIKVAQASLDRRAYMAFKSDNFFMPSKQT
jgi:riboflavin kinase